ncbi:trypsin-like peptidase domain-containing protein [Tellurirhabdus rosea]|uniref:trypsin-like peptidase domain-containing protein n=1 Tax=Tellurirhabdus rosea TaxID=2674997 RepID=UPI00225C14D2|nr:serine protease [Tellurirhabdus rosea]
MESEGQFRDWADRWVRDELTPDERRHFDAACQADPLLAQKVREQQQLADAMRLVDRRNAFRQQLEQIHQSMDMDAVRAELETPVEPLKPTGIRALWQTYRTTLAVAASVAVFSTFATLSLYKSYQSSQQQSQQYSMLRRDLNAIRQSQNAILNDISARQRALQLNPGQVAGTGFLLSPDGYLVTNTHIVRDADSVYVQSVKGDIYKAKVVYTDQNYDLAILEVGNDTTFRRRNTLPYAFSAVSSDLGERVYTLGFPRDEVVYGEGYLSSRTGYRGDTTAYQVAISVNPGNSGGPLLDERGNVIGIVSGKQTLTEGATFAIKTDYLLRAIAAIPTDSLKGSSIRINNKNTLARLSRKEQIKRLQECVFMVKVFKGEK